VLYAVPPTLHARLEIAKAIRLLVEQNEAERLRRAAEPPVNIQEIAAEIVREAFDELHKAGFNPNEPRVPAGNPDGGEWTSEGSNSGTRDPRVLSDATPDNNWIPGAQYAANRPAGIGDNQGPPLEEPPEIPPKVMATRKAINDFLKAAAYWLEEASAVDKRDATLFFFALMGTGWLADKYLPYIIAYQDPPRTL